MADPIKFLSYLAEFAQLLEDPGNEQYKQGRTIDYIGLSIRSVGELVLEEPDEYDDCRIVFVHDELNSMLEHATYQELLALKSYLDSHNYPCSIARLPGEIDFSVQAPTFDFTIVID